MAKKEEFNFDVLFEVLRANSTWLVVKDYMTAYKEARKLKKRHPEEIIVLRTSISNKTDEIITI